MRRTHEELAAIVAEHTTDLHTLADELAELEAALDAALASVPFYVRLLGRIADAINAIARRISR